MATRIGTTTGVVQSVTHGGTVVQLRGGGGSSSPWTRPAGWVAIPSIAPGSEVMYGLVAVYNNEGNYLALCVNGLGAIATSSKGSGGSGYAVNDTGTIAAPHGGTVATYKVLTVDGGGAVLTYSITAAGLQYAVANGVATATGGAQAGVGTGLTLNVLTVTHGGGYHVVWGDGTSENVAAGVVAEHQYDYANVSNLVTVNGVSYRQALVTVTPQSIQHITSIDLQKRHSALAALTTPQNTPWLEVSVNGSNLKTLVVSDGTVDEATVKVVFNSIQQFTIGENVIVDLSYQLCGQVSSLTRLSALESFVGGDFPSLTDAYYAWSGCAALRTWSGGDFPVLTDAPNAWYSNYAMESWTCGDLSALENGSSAWSGCPSLLSWSSGDFPALTTVAAAWNGCSSLRTWEAGDFPALTDASNAWGGCSSLQSWVGGDFPLLTTLNAAWNSCYSLQLWVGGDFALVSDISSAWATCPALQSWVGGNFPAVTNADAAWNADSSLQLLSIGTLTVLASVVNTWVGCLSMQSFVAPVPVTFTVANCALGRAAIVELFTTLPTIVGQTVTVTGNYGSAALSAPDLAIATGKGWTVVQ
jgi:hypothetical protein